MKIERLRFGRRPQNQRVLVIPDQWSGSVQQYYHFLLGYLAPLLRWSDRTGQRTVWLRDCGPMNAWLPVLDGIIDIELMTPGDALHVLAGRREPCVVLRGLDYPESFDGRALRGFRDRVQALLGIPAPSEASEVLVTARLSSDSFFHRPDAEVPMSGAERRSVPNLRNAVAAWPIPATLIDAAELEPQRQVAMHSHARVLVGQHGAGLTNMVWMPTGSTVIEIHPPLPAEAVDTFRRLAEALQHRYVRVPQTDVHAHVEEDLLRQALLDAI